MHPKTGRGTHPASATANALLEEIAVLEQRLRVMGVDGDCAYERAISKLYTRMVEERRQQLADLQLAAYA
ncbi:hypothetical protein [Thiogranum longum]|jgi:hypothetical protein